ncbi:MAG TPA: O-antigen ligase family protein [Polyangiaceae bacterium]|jgi:hypothetical protein|nr:O-antigen ligase family protein [Polyangiaceae bacterium]HQK16073.1 O-antigen ligase family protein [Polyangiaceae bacterium]
MFAYVLLHLIIAISLLAALVKGTKPLLWMVGFLLPLQGLSIYIGIQLNWAKFIVIPLLLNWVIRGQKHKWSRLPGIYWFGLIILYIIASAIGAMLFDEEANRLSAVARALGWGVGQTTYRYLVQGLQFVQIFLAPLIVMMVVKNCEKEDKLVSGFLAGNIFSILAGIYQIISDRLGLPWFSTDLSNAVQGNLALRESVQGFGTGIVVVTRLYGFGGEPKHTAAFAVIALSIILARAMSGELYKYSKASVVILVFGIVLTFSTSAWASFGMIILLFSWIGLNKRRKKYWKPLLLVIALIFLPVLVGANDELMGLIISRTTERAKDSDTVAMNEPKDAALLAHLRNEPARAIIGHGPGGVSFFLIRYSSREILQRGLSMSPTYTLSRIIGDFGVVGFGLILGLWLSLFRFGKRTNARLAVIISALGVVVLFMPFVVFPALLIILGSTVNYSLTCDGWDVARASFAKSGREASLKSYGRGFLHK